MASENGLNISLFERYAEKYRKAREGTQEAPGQKHLFIQLEEQYRMVNSLYKYIEFILLHWQIDPEKVHEKSNTYTIFLHAIYMPII